MDNSPNSSKTSTKPLTSKAFWENYNKEARKRGLSEATPQKDMVQSPTTTFGVTFVRK